MKRSCDTCEWSRETAAELLRGVFLDCRESPLPARVKPNHWCGRWRLAEQLADAAAGGGEAVTA
jgi:hypothetical protein